MWNLWSRSRDLMSLLNKYQSCSSKCRMLSKTSRCISRMNFQQIGDNCNVGRFCWFYSRKTSCKKLFFKLFWRMKTKKKKKNVFITTSIRWHHLQAKWISKTIYLLKLPLLAFLTNRFSLSNPEKLILLC